MGLFGGGGGSSLGMFGGQGNAGGTLGNLGVDKPSFNKPTTFITAPFTTALHGVGKGAEAMGLGGLIPDADLSLIPAIDKTPFMAPTKSIADAQTKRGFEQAQKASLSNIMAARGVNPALMQRMGQTSSENLYNQSMQQGQIAKLQEDELNRQRLIQYEQMLQEAGKAKLNAQVGMSQAAAQAKAGLLGGMGTAVAGIASMFSDERVKKNFKQDDATINKLLESFSKSKEFEYKDESMGKGKHVGPMAQDIEKAMPDMITEDENGVKKIDTTKAIMAMMAAQGQINKELKKLKKKVA